MIEKYVWISLKFPNKIDRQIAKSRRAEIEISIESYILRWMLILAYIVHAASVSFPDGPGLKPAEITTIYAEQKLVKENLKNMYKEFARMDEEKGKAEKEEEGGPRTRTQRSNLNIHNLNDNIYERGG